MAKKSFQWPGRRPDDPAHDMLAAYLVVDIQRNLEWAKQLAERIRSVQTGKITQWERIGNAYRLELTAGGALIEDLVAEDSRVQTVTLEQLSKAVETWIALQS